ncbi:hypothetical protein LZ198_24865 [Myxococcus sp. K15C18031901]|uniref:hypothetical protein n=1 Tax=Myxococcus dinghuensis TaxID=2906761 RepID=UPI0020A79AFA|nr:hypothetical protein [Myxococcus dinghuensis]MCP3102105.1 hypothetical protein [Myxococcus dinghuensis]
MSSSSDSRARGLVPGLLLALLAVAPWNPARAESRLRVAGATANNEVKLRTTAEEFHGVLRVDLVTPPPPPDAGVEEALAGGVTVLVDPLQGSDGAQVPLTAKVVEAADGGVTAPVSRRASLHLELSAKLPAPGDYSGQVVLVHADGRETTALTLTRVLTVPVVQFVAPAPALATQGDSWDAADATVRLAFKETAGVGGKVAVPQLLPLQRKTADLGTAPVQPRLTGARFALEGAGPDGKDLELPARDGSIDVSPHGGGTLLLSLRGLDGPGEYTGTVRLVVPHGAAVEQGFVVWARTPWQWGALLIALGAVCSYGVRLYSRNLRPRAQRLSRARTLRKRAVVLTNGQVAGAQELGRVLVSRVDTLIFEIRKPVRGIRVGDAELARVEPELRLYAAWGAATRELQALPEELRPEAVRTLLSGAEDVLRAGEAPATRLAELVTAVRAQNVTALATAAMGVKLQELETQVTALTQQLGEDPLSFRLSYELLPKVRAVRARAAKGELGAARAEFEQARRAYFDILCAELSVAVASPRTPRGFTFDEWRELTTEVKKRLEQARTRADTSVDEGFVLYRGAYAHYVRRLILELRGEVAAFRAEVTSDARKAALDGVDTKLHEAMASLGSEAPHLASAKYREARDAFQAAQVGQVNDDVAALREAVAEKRAEATTPEARAELAALDALLNEAVASAVESPTDAARKVAAARALLEAYPSPPRMAASHAGLESFSTAATSGDATDGTPVASAPTGGSLPSLPEEAPAAATEDSDALLDGMPLPAPRFMWVVELGVLALLTVIAVVLGLQLLNVFSPTWGGFGAGMTAFLWGFGLHQVGNATFDGLTGLMARVERPGAGT